MPEKNEGVKRREEATDACSLTPEHRQGGLLKFLKGVFDYFIMKKYKTIMKKDKELVQTTCDWCGKGDLKDGFFEGGSGSISFSYGSKKYDGATYSLDICDKCFDRIIRPQAKRVDNG